MAAARAATPGGPGQNERAAGGDDGNKKDRILRSADFGIIRYCNFAAVPLWPGLHSGSSTLQRSFNWAELQRRSMEEAANNDGASVASTAATLVDGTQLTPQQLGKLSHPGDLRLVDGKGSCFSFSFRSDGDGGLGDGRGLLGRRIGSIPAQRERQEEQAGGHHQGREQVRLVAFYELMTRFIWWHKCYALRAFSYK